MEKYPPPRTLLFDIENSPNLGWYYDESKEYNILDVEQYSFIHSVAYQWEGENKIHVIALPDFPLYKRDKKDDYALIKAVHKLFEEADILIGHNGDNFDIKKINARFIYHRLQPPGQHKTADTLKLARKIQNSGSNRLDALSKYYGLGKKISNTGKDLWLPIARGQATKEQWKQMKEYNIHDVYLLARLWPLLRPWGKTPNLNLVHGRPKGCPTCYGTHIQSRGERPQYTTGTSVHMYVCMDCGKRIKGESEKLLSKVIHK